MGIIILVFLAFGIFWVARAVVRKVLGLLEARKSLKSASAPSTSVAEVVSESNEKVCWSAYDVPAFERRGMTFPTLIYACDLGKICVRLKKQLDSLTNERLAEFPPAPAPVKKKRVRKAKVAFTMPTFQLEVQLAVP